MSHWHDTMVDRRWRGLRDGLDDQRTRRSGRDLRGMGVRDLATTLERFTGGQLALVFARRCRAQGATDWNLRPPPSVVLRPQLAPHAGAVSIPADRNAQTGRLTGD